MMTFFSTIYSFSLGLYNAIYSFYASFRFAKADTMLIESKLVSEKEQTTSEMVLKKKTETEMWKKAWKSRMTHTHTGVE